MIPIDPRGMDAMGWTDRTGALLASYVPVMKIGGEEEWKEWGSHVRQVLFRSGILIPDPYPYDDWTLWAFRLNQTIESL